MPPPATATVSRGTGMERLCHRTQRRPLGPLRLDHAPGRIGVDVAMRRVSVIGASGSGKTTVGRALAARLGVPCVEMDELHWTHPDWELPPLEEFRARVDEATQGASWVVDGSYGKARDIVWSRADTVVW